MTNKKSTFMGAYRLASILNHMNIGNNVLSIYKKTGINYDELKAYVDKLEEKGFIKTEKNGNERGKPRKIVYVDAKIRQRAEELINAYNEFSAFFNQK